MCRLPERIRPSVLAFGGLSDSFLPFEGGDRVEVTLELCGVVMKAVQAWHPHLPAEECMPCSAKLGDDESSSKAQVRLITGRREGCVSRRV